ncbi:MAG TPA: hypothetical protein VNV65_09790 [Candidatus Solibacter sp.]|jgi:hypothetical protein|nr:hypothetical protein [Candidatus Solibacter sp.]
MSSLQAANWSKAAYPFDCGAPQNGQTFGYFVQQVSYLYLSGTASALVLVRCNAGAGSPPVGLYLFQPGPLGRPELAGTLLAITYPVDISNDFQAHGFTFQVSALGGATVTMTAGAYSSATVPNCCPDASRTFNWTWNGTGFTRSG